MGLFRAGETFLLGEPGRKQHLHVVLCGPAGSPPTILVVPLNTRTLYIDTTVVLLPGEHPFITRESSVSYDFMCAMPVDELSRLEELRVAGQAGSFERRDPVSPELLARLVRGALESDLTPKGMARALRERLGDQSR